jgi:NRAMP (natural resistance-associated macrophage protein)-like metal ion transporter
MANRKARPPSRSGDPILRVLTNEQEKPQEQILKKSSGSDFAVSGGPAAGRSSVTEVRRKGFLGILQLLGPGLITGASDDDPSGIATYSQVGSQFGYGLLWTALLTYPLMSAVQELCARIALQTGVGLGVSLRRKFPAWLVGTAVLGLLIANTINVGADLGAVAAGASLLGGGALHSGWLIVPVAILILVLELFVTYETIFKIFKWLTLALFAYLITAFFAHPKLLDVVAGTFIPHIELSRDFLMALVALLGTTISPYLFFWQASSEVEELKAAGKTADDERGRGVLSRVELRAARTDVLVGMAFSNVVMYFIVLTSAAVLHAHGQTQIQTAQDAAKALAPFAGPFASAIFALGLIGAGLLAIPILSGSAAYAIKEFLGIKGSLATRPRFRPTFYLILAVATLAGVGIDLLGINPIRALFITAVINGVVAPPLLVLINLLGTDKKIMKSRTSGSLSLGLTWAAASLMTLAAIAMFATLLRAH